MEPIIFCVIFCLISWHLFSSAKEMEKKSKERENELLQKSEQVTVLTMRVAAVIGLIAAFLVLFAMIR